jgi:hypothetical protein
MEKSTVSVLIVTFVICLVAGSSFGYVIGSNQSKSFESEVVALNPTITVTLTRTEGSPVASSLGSVPVSPDPFESSENVSGTGTTWYVPIVFLAAGTTTNLYVNYDCSGACPGSNSDSISSMGLTFPMAYALASTGKLVSTTGMNFTSSSVVYNQNTSETVLYKISIAQEGYYTFSLPNGCFPEPIVYVKQPGTSFNYSPIANMLQSINPDDVGCSDVVQVTILGFTGAYYTEIPIQLNAS